ncbi:hypothetical protein AC1031_022074 [Aphanomyces cochlioides]|nr:hypothetical protein AC1031_022074 [Aphanomyces cochlioides]
MASELCVWYILVDANQTPKMEESSVKMQSGPNCRIDDFKDAVYAKVSPILPEGIVAAQLKVYSDMDALKVKNPVSLHPTQEMTQYDANMSSPLVVVVPDRDVWENPHKKQRVDVDAVQVSEILPVPAPVLPPEPVPQVPQIDISGRYVRIPRALLKWSYIGQERDTFLYPRAQVKELWQFLNDRVIQDKKKGYIVGPPGTGKSMCTLSYVASLDREEWHVIWIHLTKDDCTHILDMATKQYWRIASVMSKLPRSHDDQKLFVCLDGFHEGDYHMNLFRKHIAAQLKDIDRFVVCSSMSTLGKRNPDDDNRAGIEFFFMYSWTRDEYRTAVKDQEFFNSVKVNLEATPPSDVNEETSLTGDDYLDGMIDKKFYYAGGSCRYMFQLSTDEVKLRIEEAVESTPNKADLVKYCVGMYHKNEINRLYGLDKNRERYAVSEYALSCFVNASGKDTIVELANNLGAAKTPPMHGYLYEWLFLASVKEENVELIDVNSEKVQLPMTDVYIFDPTKNFKTIGEGEEHRICADKKWLKPVKWNQCGYDALYFDMVATKVIFIQLTIAANCWHEEGNDSRDLFRCQARKVGRVQDKPSCGRQRIGKV